MCIVIIIHRVIVLSEQYNLSHPTAISLCVCLWVGGRVQEQCCVYRIGETTVHDKWWWSLW